MSASASDSSVGQRHRLTGWRWLGLLLICACGFLAGLLELLWVPLRAGTVLVPLSVGLALAGGVAFPRWARAFVDSTAAAAAPIACWLVPVVGLAMVPRPEGDVLVRAADGEQWVYYAVLLVGAFVGFASAVLTAPALPSGRGQADARVTLPARPSSGSRGGSSSPRIGRAR